MNSWWIKIRKVREIFTEALQKAGYKFISPRSHERGFILKFHGQRSGGGCSSSYTYKALQNFIQPHTHTDSELPHCEPPLLRGVPFLRSAEAGKGKPPNPTQTKLLCHLSPSHIYPSLQDRFDSLILGTLTSLVDFIVLKTTISFEKNINIKTNKH